MECKICDKKFTGIVSFKQHEASEKHQKKVLLHQKSNLNAVALLSNNTDSNNQIVTASSSNNTDSNNQIVTASSSNNTDFNSQIIISLPCTLCSETFNSLPDFAAHTNSKEHMYMLKKKFETTLAVEKSFECDSTIDNVQLKYDASKSDQSHSIPQHNGYPEMIAKNIPYYLRCEQCSKNFSGPEPYQQHIDSIAHKKKCGEIQSMQTMSCDICKKNFSGPVPYQQHMDSDTHKKKLLFISNNTGSDLKNTVPNGIINCEICIMTFSGPIPYDQHLSGDIHKKNIERNHTSPMNGKENHKMEVDSTVQAAKTQVGAIQSLAYYCEICDKPCAGPIPYEQHLRGSVHIKNSIKVLATSKRKEVLDLLSSKSEGSGTYANPTVPSAEVSFSSSRKGENNSMSTDLKTLIKDSLNLELFGVTPEKLNMTFFKVDENIDFDIMLKNNVDITSLEIDGNNDDEEENEKMDE